MMNDMTLRVGVVLVAFGMAMACGCGGPGSDRPATYAVTGTVTLDGTAVDGATVTFVASGTGDPAVGTTDASGNYSLKSWGTAEGAVPGKYKVQITKYDSDQAAASGGGDSAEMPADYNPDATQDAPESKNALPSQYESASESGLDATVTEDASKNVFDFKLTSSGGAEGDGSSE